MIQRKASRQFRLAQSDGTSYSSAVWHTSIFFNVFFLYDLFVHTESWAPAAAYEALLFTLCATKAQIETWRQGEETSWKHWTTRKSKHIYIYLWHYVYIICTNPIQYIYICIYEYTLVSKRKTLATKYDQILWAVANQKISKASTSSKQCAQIRLFQDCPFNPERKHGFSKKYDPFLPALFLHSSFLAVNDVRFLHHQMTSLRCQLPDL